MSASPHQLFIRHEAPLHILDVALGLERHSMLDSNPAVHSDPEILGGVPVFIGTRVPAQNLFDYLAAGDSLDDFLHSFPTVSREQASAGPEQAGEALKNLAYAA
ncbi:MAG TPA: DUF433 domain-containing protein [Longimicrobium sp.]|nr:DUF433 domain-containing protein [Longimicrobium sp.]